MDNSNLSLSFYHYLCNIIGTEEGVNTRRHIFSTFDHVNSSNQLTNISSGSKAEGLDLEGSDMDLMKLMNPWPVYENKNTVRQLSNSFPFVMNITDCKPGFTLLQRYFPFDNDPFCQYNNGVWHLSSFKLRDINTTHYKYVHVIPHGPCSSTPDGTFDIAMCLRCKDWISQAQPWILRSRNSWASNNVINAIFEFGVLFVPIGCKNSPNIDLEWRISFSYAEKLLIWSFNHVQLLCYALLKILLKDVIKTTTGDLLCSYFLKTIMFWVCEEINSSQWVAKRSFTCFTWCLNRLIYCVQYKTCVHYFIPENDLFAERFNKPQQSLLLSTLKDLRKLGWKCLLHTKTLASFRGFPLTAQLISIQNVSYLRNLGFLESAAQRLRLKQGIYFCIRSIKRYFYIYMVSKINGYIGQNLLISERSGSGNKHMYNVNQKRLCHLVIALSYDAISGWLMLASFFYVNNQFKTFKEIQSYCLLTCTADKTRLIQEKRNRFTTLQGEMRFRHISLQRQYLLDYITFAQSSQILPKEIGVCFDGDEAKVPSMVFGLFLKFLCDYHSGNENEKDVSLHALEFVIQNEYCRNDHYPLKAADIFLPIAYSLKYDTH